MTPAAGGARRVELIDALRAVALVGILQINIQSFVWGAGDPLGSFAEPPRAADAVAFVLAAAFVESKFIALFAFLFGAGFALQTKRLRRAGATVEAARAVVRRRLAFLLAVGVAHGVLLYHGDILTAYALCGFVLVPYVGARPARLARAAVIWWGAYAALSLALFFFIDGSRPALAPGGEAAALPAAAVERFEVYTEGSYLAQWPYRIEDYALALAALPFMAPFIIGLFLLGALAGRLGWLTHPGRHPRVWRNARRIGWVSAPVAAAGALLNFLALRDAPGDPPYLGLMLVQCSFGLMAWYVAAVAARRDRAPVRAAIRWLAPAGRMPLTNYLMQSVVMGALLSGWGLGWGATLRHAGLALLALAIAAVQIVASRCWIARFGQGPVEALWRRWTWAGMR